MARGIWDGKWVRKPVSRVLERYYEAGPSEPCVDCGKRIGVEVARIKHTDGTYAHAFEHQCPEREQDA